MNDSANRLPDGGWRKVRAPKRWSVAPGEILEGTYLGTKEAQGPHGDYLKYLIADEDQNVWFLSGSVCDTLFQASLAHAGSKLRIVFLGMKQGSGDFEYKDYELYVKDPMIPPTPV